MKKILSFITLFLFMGAELSAWQAQPPGAQPPTPIIRLNTGEHLLCGKSRDGKLEFEDGTLFKALSSDAMKVYEEWEYHEHLAFTPNIMPMGGGDYFITNLDRQEFIQANFYAEPNRGNDYAQYIYHVDPYYGEIYLKNSNGDEAVFQADKRDFALLAKWEQNDRVIIGKNDLWFEKLRSDCEFVIINCDKNYLKYVRINPL